MINIISKAVISNKPSGPQKVVRNLIKGLDIIKYPYVINHDLNSCKRLWIHDDTYALSKLNSINPDTKVIIGPNLYVLPRDIPSTTDMRRCLYIHPSPWAVNFWRYLGFNKCNMDYWPTGIDTETHRPFNTIRDTVLVYFKQRYHEELNNVVFELKKRNINYKVIEYGKYKHQDYLINLKRTKYIVWIGRQETQGIALEEALSMNIPIIVFDVSRFGHWHTAHKDMKKFNDFENAYPDATSAYYFDKSCGEKTRDIKMVPHLIEKMEEDFLKYHPREYITKNLNLKKQAVEFINLYEKHFNLSLDLGMKEKLLNNKKWRNSRIDYIILIKLKDILKYILRKYN